MFAAEAENFEQNSSEDNSASQKEKDGLQICSDSYHPTSQTKCRWVAEIQAVTMPLWDG